MSGRAPYSLRRRLLAWLLVSLVAVGLLALLDTWREATLTADAVSDRVLAGSALAIAERVVVSENGTIEVDIPYVALAMLTSAAQDRVFYRVDSPPGTFITGYKELPALTGTPQERAEFLDGTFRGEDIRLAVLARTASTGISAVPYVVTVAETTIARRQLAEALLLRSAVRLAVIIAGAAALVWIGVTASLRPLYRLRDAIARRSPADLDPIEERVPAEVSGLVETVNSFMGRLNSALSALRNFTGNASHQLRTPMAIVRTQLALSARAARIEDAKAAVQAADEAVVEAERVLGQLLLMSRVDSAAVQPAAGWQAVDLAELARTVVADSIVRAADAGVDLGFEEEGPAIVVAEPLLMRELLRNLVDNAIAYAGKGSEATVRVGGASRPWLEVSDTGRGVADGKLTALGGRFERASDKPGAGLGLSIVREIAALFGATATIESVPGSGFRVSVAFGKSASAGRPERLSAG